MKPLLITLLAHFAAAKSDVIAFVSDPLPTFLGKVKMINCMFIFFVEFLLFYILG